MAKKSYRCIKCGLIEKTDLVFDILKPNKNIIIEDPSQDIRMLSVDQIIVPQKIWHKGCGQPVEVK